jgi:hypothetical protein
MHILGRLACAICLGLALVPAVAQEAQWRRAFDVMWQAQWAETGELQNATVWPAASGKTLRFGINPEASAAGKTAVTRAVASVLGHMGWRGVQVPFEAAQLRFKLRHYTESELQQSRCSTRSESAGGAYLLAELRLSEQAAYRCVLHELLHAVGLPGHPDGASVLSYFVGNPLVLSELDAFLLKALYSPQVVPDMPVLLLVRELNAQWIDQEVSPTERDQAKAFEQRWFDEQLLALRAFACEKGPPLAVLARSGRLTEAGLATGRQQARAALQTDCAQFEPQSVRSGLLRK